MADPNDKELLEFLRNFAIVNSHPETIKARFKRLIAAYMNGPQDPESQERRIGEELIKIGKEEKELRELEEQAKQRPPGWKKIVPPLKCLKELLAIQADDTLTEDEKLKRVDEKLKEYGI